MVCRPRKNRAIERRHIYRDGNDLVLLHSPDSIGPMKLGCGYAVHYMMKAGTQVSTQARDSPGEGHLCYGSRHCLSHH